MMIVNVVLSAAIASFAWRGGVDLYLVAVVFWAAYRVEVALTNQISIAKLLSVLVHAETVKLEAKTAEHEAAIARIARNN